MTEEEYNRNVDKIIENVGKWQAAKREKKEKEELDIEEEAEGCYAEKLANLEKRDRIVASKMKMRKREVDVMKKKLFIAGMAACLVISAVGVSRFIARGRIAQRVRSSGLVPEHVASFDGSSGVTVNYTDPYGNHQVFGAEYFVSMFSEEDMKQHGVTPDEFAIYLGYSLGITEGIVEDSTVLGREKLCLEELGAIIVENINEQVEEAIGGQAYVEDAEITEGRSR